MFFKSYVRTNAGRELENTELELREILGCQNFDSTTSEELINIFPKIKLHHKICALDIIASKIENDKNELTKLE
jgi:hypothetical protein